MSVFGWSLPAGCTQQHIDSAFGCEGPLDCPVCQNGVELDGPDCTIDAGHGVTCPEHGCVACQRLEDKRVSYVDDDCAWLAENNDEQLIFADLEAYPENARCYSPGIVAKWRAQRGGQ